VAVGGGPGVVLGLQEAGGDELLDERVEGHGVPPARVRGCGLW